MEFINATGLDRKSGVAKWRDLQCALRLSQIPDWEATRINLPRRIKSRPNRFRNVA